MNSKKTELLFICEKFLRDNGITCEESCYQLDSVYENAPSFIEDIFTLLNKKED